MLLCRLMRHKPARIREAGRSVSTRHPENSSDKGRVFRLEWLKQISKMTFMESESFALPGDLVEDVRRKFGTKRGQHRRS
jgi:hypothetical protein